MGAWQEKQNRTENSECNCVNLQLKRKVLLSCRIGQSRGVTEGCLVEGGGGCYITEGKVRCLGGVGHGEVGANIS